MQPVPQILVRNFERCSRVLCTESGTLDNLNMSSISTRLIQDVGRLCERYASDFIISWDAVRKQLEPRHITEPYHAVELFAIRLSGVDHNSFFMSRLRNDSRGSFNVNGSGTFTDAAMLLGRAFPDCRPTSVPNTANSLPLSERLKGPDSQLKQSILDLHTQAVARAIDGMTGGKPMDYSRFVHENISCHFAPEDEGKIQIGGTLNLADGWDGGKAACVYHCLLALPFTMI